LKKTPCI